MKHLLLSLILLTAAAPLCAQQSQQCIQDDDQSQGQNAGQGQSQTAGQQGPCTSQSTLLDELQCLQKKTDAVIKHLKKVMAKEEKGARDVVNNGYMPMTSASQALNDGSQDTVTIVQRTQYKQSAAGVPEKVQTECSKGQKDLDEGHQKFACVDSAISQISTELEAAKQHIADNIQRGSQGYQQIAEGRSAPVGDDATPAQVRAADQALDRAQKRVAAAQKRDQDIQQKLANQIDQTLQQLKTVVAQGGTFHKYDSQARAVLRKGGDSGEADGIYSCLGDQGSLQHDLSDVATGLQVETGDTFRAAQPRVSDFETRFQRDLQAVEASEGKASSDLEKLSQLLQGVGTGIDQDRQPDPDLAAGP